MTLPIANILQKKVRSLISVLAVSLGITLLLVLVGLTKGSIKEVADRIENVGADIIVQQVGATNFFALKSGVLPEKYREFIANIPGVEAVSPVVTWTTTFYDNFYVVYGIDPDQFSSIGGGLEIVDGRDLREAGDVVIELVDVALVVPGAGEVGARGQGGVHDGVVTLDGGHRTERA